MKKVIILVLVLALMSVVFMGCTPNADNNGEKTDININVIMPDGAPALAMAKLFNDKPAFEGYKINYEIVLGAQGISAKMTSDEADIAVLPTNMAANLYNKGKDIKIVASNVFGLLYMVGKAPLQSLEQLKGKVVYNLGQGNTPDFVFQTILEQNNIPYSQTDNPTSQEVGLRYDTEAQQLIARMAANQIDYAILGEPQVSQAVNATKDSDNPFSIILNLQQAWEDGYPQVSTVVKASILNEHEEFINAFLTKMQENVEWITENPDLVKTALTANGSKVNFFDADSIARCNIRLERTSEIKETIENYLQLMYNFNASFVGNKMPEQGLYYV